jgi:hypothetical protein
MLLKGMENKIRLAPFLLLILLPVYYTCSVKAHEMGKFEKYEKKIFGTTINEYANYLRGKTLKGKEGLSCIKIKVDYINYMNDLMSSQNISGALYYYYEGDILVLSKMFQEFGSKGEFNESIKDIPDLLNAANNPRGKIPEDSIYLALVTRLFSEYRLELGKYDVSYDLKNYKKCKDYMSNKHQ